MKGVDGIMKNEKPGKALKIVCRIGIVIFLIAVVAAVYMMYHHMGQVPGIDFGPGQYYYTDIPGWQKYFVPDYYNNTVPAGILIALFFLWGFLMYRLWTFLDKKLN